MNDLGQSLLDKVDEIIDIWVEEVRRDEDIGSNKGLAYEAIHDGLPDVLSAVATLLTNSFSDQEDDLEYEALDHGAVRAEQGFDIAEVVREYRTLRNVLLTVLEPDLKTGSVGEVLTAVRQIDNVLDDVVLLSLESYVKQRLDLLEQMHAQLLLTNQELIRLVQIQKDNVSHLAHELKNPLNSIIGFSSILLRRQRQQLKEESASTIEMTQIERILNNGRQLLRLINDASEASKQETGQVQLRAEPVRVTELVRMVVDAFEHSAQDKGITLSVECDHAPEKVTTDSLRLQQIISNLMSNAIRYTDSGSISLSCYTVSEEQWAIAVCDTGKGISPEQQSKIFEPYFRIGEEEDYLPESSGLGLTIVNKLIQFLQGSIEIESEVGTGSTFTVFLPLQLQREQPA
ncbi:MAG: sensor histidine kinase [Phormidesmis sp.]